MFSLLKTIDIFRYLFVGRLVSYILNLTIIAWLINDIKSIDWSRQPDIHPFDSDVDVDTDEFSDFSLYHYHNNLLFVSVPIESVVTFIKYLRVANNAFTERSFNNFVTRYDGRISYKRFSLPLTVFMLDEERKYLKNVEITIKILLYQTTKLETLLLLKESEDTYEEGRVEGIALCRRLLDFSLSLIDQLRFAVKDQHLRELT